MKTLAGLTTAALLSIGLLAAPATAAPYQPNPATDVRADVERTETTIRVVTSGGQKLRGTVTVRIIKPGSGVVREVQVPLRRGKANAEYRRLARGNYKLVVITDATKNRFDDREVIRFSV